jgi:hypothetical protein
MKFLISLLAVVSTSAYACPDISGTYVSAEDTYIKYVQTGCTSLKRYLSNLDSNGKVTFPEPATVFTMDGKAECGIRDFCTTVTAHDDGIEFSLNFTGGVDTDSHGSCDQRGFVLSLDSDQNLIGNYAVTNCTDKFAGTAVKTFKHYK